MIDLLDKYNYIVSMVERSLDAGVIPPNSIFLLCEPHPIIIPAIYSNDKEKRTFHKYVGQLAEEKGAIGVVFISDAWVKSFEKDKEPIDYSTPVRDQPGSVDAVIVVLISPMKRHMTTFRYTKENDKLTGFRKDVDFNTGTGMLFDSYFKIDA